MKQNKLKYLPCILITLCMLNLFLLCDKAIAFTPLKVCPEMVAGDDEKFVSSLKKALKEGDEIDIETYMALVQCRAGRPFSMAAEKYISVRNPGSKGVTPEFAKSFSQQLWEKINRSEFFSQLTGDIGSWQNLNSRTEVLMGALVTLPFENQNDDKESAALRVADSLLKQQQDNPEGLYKSATKDNETTLESQINAEAAAAMLMLGKKYSNDQYIRSGMAVADILTKRPLSMDFTSNAAKAYLFAVLANVHKDKSDDYISRAVQIFKNGVFSAMYDSGTYQGMWLDPYTQSLSNRYDIIFYAANLLNLLPDSHPDRAYLLKKINAASYAIAWQYQKHRGIQAGDGVARMHCALNGIQGFELRPTKGLINSRTINNELTQNTEKRALEWFQISYDFVVSDLVYAQGRYLTSPYSIMCMLKLDNEMTKN